MQLLKSLSVVDDWLEDGVQVGPAFGNRFSTAFLQGLSAWLDQFGKQPNQASSSSNISAGAADGLHGSATKTAAVARNTAAATPPNGNSLAAPLSADPLQPASLLSSFDSESAHPNNLASKLGQVGSESSAGHIPVSAADRLSQQPAISTDEPSTAAPSSGLDADSVAHANQPHSVDGSPASYFADTCFHSASAGSSGSAAASQQSSAPVAPSAGTTLPSNEHLTAPEAEHDSVDRPSSVASSTGSASISNKQHAQQSTTIDDCQLQEPGQAVRSMKAGLDNAVHAQEQQGVGPSPSDVQPNLQLETGVTPQAPPGNVVPDAEASTAVSGQAAAPEEQWLDGWMEDIQALRQAAPVTTTPVPADTSPMVSSNDSAAQKAASPMPLHQSSHAAQDFKFNFDVEDGGSKQALRSAKATPSSKVPCQRPARLQLSLRLEHMRLSDGDLLQIADWAQAEVGRAEIVKLWLFDNSIADEGAFHVARMLHEGMQEVGLLVLHLLHEAPVFNITPPGSIWHSMACMAPSLCGKMQSKLGLEHVQWLTAALFAVNPSCQVQGYGSLHLRGNGLLLCGHLNSDQGNSLYSQACSEKDDICPSQSALALRWLAV